jgi:hypothetical protein
VSIERFGNPDSPLLRFLGMAPDNCSLCCKPLVDPVVFWHLGDLFLSLHPECAEELGGNLIYEARRARRIVRGQSLLSGIDQVWREPAGREP